VPPFGLDGGEEAEVAGAYLINGDAMEIELSGFGRALRNPIQIDRSMVEFVPVETI